ncbi:MAG: hypothetical protein SFX72_12520 [Isosphaeraceae bacterium]|nr:hypothetical protein [Isosphaeraceae bacterium]
MTLPMPADAAVRLAGGLAALLLLAPWRVVPPTFFRTHCQVMLGLFVLAALAIATVDQPSWVAGLAIAGSTFAFVGSIGWGLGLFRVGFPATFIVAGCSIVLLCATGASGDLRIDLLNAASRLTSSFLIGSGLTAMLLGHHYLTAPAMSIVPLERFVRCIAWGLGIRVVLATIASVVVFERGTGTVEPLFVAIRWGMGFVAPAIGTYLTWRTVAIRSTQSATGILYIVVTLILFGELTSLILARSDTQGIAI